MRERGLRPYLSVIHVYIALVHAKWLVGLCTALAGAEPGSWVSKLCGRKVYLKLSVICPLKKVKFWSHKLKKENHFCLATT